jgi:hypothetical protein
MHNDKSLASCGEEDLMKSDQMGWRDAVRGGALMASLSIGVACQAADTMPSKTTLVATLASQYAKQGTTLMATMMSLSGTGATPAEAMRFKDGATTIPVATRPGGR